ncbi:GNAT family N-acetyltransferase [Cardiobacterium hominis]|uniref:GNAT family N-acetyltransferase n=1 Tax=Cardiobacterium hominis TaxID=2718 RepID=UPI002491636C|nr:N-acetyltransferase [Cardiobacterium hominis]
MTTLHITPCEPADCNAIDQLTARAYAPSGFAADDPYFIEILNAAQRAQQALVLVARQNSVPVGTLTCALPGSSWQEIAGADEAELRILAVEPAQQRQGIGSALVRASIEHARRAGCTALVLSSAAWMHAGHRLYERLGFCHTPERDWQPRADVYLTAYRLELTP